MSLIDYLYSEKFIPDVIDRYVQELSASNDLSNIMHANKLRLFKKMIFDDDFLEETRKFFDKCFTLVKEKYSVLRKDKKTIGCSIDGRRKGLIQTEEKCRLYLEQGLSLNLVRDFFAFRFVLYGNVENLQEYCYKVTEDVIDLAIREGYTICEALPLVNSISGKNAEVYSEFKYSQYTKDYIRFPKESTGYQSLHFVLVDLYGRHLEIQVRTDSMHLMSEYADKQNHSRHKNLRYGADRLKDLIDRERVTIVGYRCLSRRMQIIEFLSDKITDIQLTQINQALKNASITEVISSIKKILIEYGEDNLNDWISYISQVEDKITDFAGVETGVSIFHRQTF